MTTTGNDGRPLVLAITACPTGIAHTYMAAENLAAAAEEAGVRVRIETHGSIGVEDAFTDDELAAADAVVIAADTQIDRSRFAGLPLVATGVDEAIRRPGQLLRSALDAPASRGRGSGARGAAEGAEGAGHGGRATARTATATATAGAGGAGSDRGAPVGAAAEFGRTLYRALMNGVSHMIPFVVTGGLLIAVALSFGGVPGPEGLTIPDDSLWNTVSKIGALAFSLMVPVLSGYIAMAIADRPGLAPGMVTGLIAVTGELYGAETGAGFLGGIVTGLLSGYVALGIRKIPVQKYVAPIWPIIVIPIITTVVVGLLFVFLLGQPIAALFTAMTEYLGGMEGDSVLLLGAIIGAMIAFDMGGPFNKTAFLFAGGLIAAGNAAPMGMAAVAIAVPPLGVGLATLIRRAWFTKPERDAGIAALFMGFFGITEGAIPLAAARPLQVIPANVIGGAVAAALAGLFAVKDNVMHGGPIVAVLGAVENVGWFFAALLVGVAVTCVLTLLLMGLSRRRSGEDAGAGAVGAAGAAGAGAGAAVAGAGAGAAAESGAATGGTGSGSRESQSGESPSRDSLVTEELVLLDLDGAGSRPEEIIRALAEAGANAGRIGDVDAVVAAALAREESSTTAVGHGVAIPHARCAGGTAPMVAFARLSDGAAWPAPDDEPVRMVFLISVPEDAGKSHLKILAKLARALMREEFRRDLDHADGRERVVEIVRGAVAPEAAATS
ncbi:fructose-specific PTS transporter subunit EIIC [Corynebacterium hansenii]|uniref:Fructose-specific PTS transporter subunit EIIC n=1 Tax=Corynebacterium hansenii TaxID=394964 RepID=A0ABV7ZMS2_9CORY|nr:fructose-specific PTS transporter subunit EIIC [Corynebacterium hansenii]WJZ00401.1 PTS system mannose-specific EIIBCA component [Corynebacterium hansenii]